MTNAPPAYASLDQFFTDFKLPHRMFLLCDKLGIESLDDLKDVKPYDLHDISYLSWAKANLTVVERNRFCRAVAFIDNTEWHNNPPQIDSRSHSLLHDASDRNAQ